MRRCPSLCLPLWALSLLLVLSAQKTFLEVSDRDGPILGIAVNYGTVAVAVKKKVFLYRDTGSEVASQGSLQGVIDLKDDVKEVLLELKLTSRDTVLLCDTNTCRLCASGSTCTTLKREKKVSKGAVHLATATLDDQKLFLRMIDQRNTAWISSYSLDRNSNELLPSSTSVDLSFLKETGLSGSFSRNGFFYFVGSSQSRYEPTLLAGRDNDKSETGLVRLSRVCGRDATKAIESRIDVVLSCDPLPPAGGQIVNYASFFDPLEGALYVAAVDHANKTKGRDEDGAPVVVCRFRYEQIEQRFNQVWDICQQTTKDEAKRCSQWDESVGGHMPEHCFIFTKSDGYSQQCSRFEGPHSTGGALSNCNLGSHESFAYRYGSLNDYRPLQGETVAFIRQADSTLISQVLPDRKGSLLLANFQGSVFRAPSTSARSWPSWSRNNTGDVIDRMAMSSDGEKFFYATPKKVISQALNCETLFSTCDSLAFGGFSDSLQCGWCPSEDGRSGEVHSLHDKFACPVPMISGKCPPVLHAVHFDPVKNVFNIIGKNLRSMSAPAVTVCGRDCSPSSDSTETLMQCTVAGPVKNANEPCEVVMTGSVANTKMRLLRPPLRDEASGTSTAASTGGMSRTSKALIAVFSCLFIIVFIAVIMWYARKKYMSNTRKHGGEDYALGSGLYNPTALNSYSQHPAAFPMEGFSPYEQVAKEIDPKLKIDSNAIRLESPIGKGHFGIVYRSIYRPPGAACGEQMVACKMLQTGVAGVREFVSEGLTMARFEHPRVMRLIGIAFADDFSPIIVTEYMANGDLLRYLKDPSKRPTLRDLLQFSIQIAEGMDYLHSLKFIHRDLAARNCMLDDMLNIRIADFGLCRELVNYEQNYEVLHRDRDLPLRWMPLEALQAQLFTLKGDVWAYGVVLWELTTRGMMPYAQLPGVLLQEFLESGKRLSQPTFCPAQLYDEVMLSCWDRDPDERPSFKDLIGHVKRVVGEMEENQRQQMNTAYEQVTPLRNSQNGSVTTPVTVETMLGDADPPNSTVL